MAPARSLRADTANDAAGVDSSSLRQQIESFGEWFHNLVLHGVPTAPAHFLGDYPTVKWRAFAEALPADLRGCTVLDVGCNAGFYSQEMKRRGADRVVGIDSDPRYLAQARFAADVVGLDIEFRELSVYDVAQLDERFDVVLFMGVLYHLRHPLLALDLLHQHVVDDLFVVQSMLRGTHDVAAVAHDYDFNDTTPFDDRAFPALFFVEHRYAGDATNWWIPNRACAEAMLRSAGFTIESHPEPEVFICHRTSPPSLAGPSGPQPGERS
jgi:tRNA (mo5U34)-methyltransferase